MGETKIVNAGVDTLVLYDMSHEVVFWGIEDAYELSERLPVLWAYAAGQVDGGPDGVPDGWLERGMTTWSG